MRGGSFNNRYDYLAASEPDGDDVTYEYASVGFRVVEVPEPATFLLLGLGGLAVIRRR